MNDSYDAGRNRGAYTGGDWHGYQEGRNDRDRIDAARERSQGDPNGMGRGGGGGGGGGGLPILVLGFLLLLIIVPSAVLAVPGALVLMLVTPLLAGSGRGRVAFTLGYSTAFYAFLAYTVLCIGLQTLLTWLSMHQPQWPRLLHEAAMVSSLPQIALVNEYLYAAGKPVRVPVEQMLAFPAFRQPLAIAVAFLATQLPALLAMVLVLRHRIGWPYEGGFGILRALVASVVLVLVCIPMLAIVAFSLMPHVQLWSPGRVTPWACIAPMGSTVLLIWLLGGAALLTFAMRLPTRLLPGAPPLAGGYGTALLALLVHATLLLAALYTFRAGDAWLNGLYLLSHTGGTWPPLVSLPGWLAVHLTAVVVTASVLSLRLRGPYSGPAGWLAALVWGGGLSGLWALAGLWAASFLLRPYCGI